MKFINPTPTDNFNEKISLKCPFCHQYGMFELVGKAVKVDRIGFGFPFYAGSFSCPNSNCNTHVFIIYKANENVVTSYPHSIIDFNKVEIPDEITNTFEEALQCHANNLYTASAIMIRRTLEELCSDKNAEGGNLKQRIQNLNEKVILPPSLFEGLDNLRLLGNDAAHVESRDYKNIGQEEVELAIDVTKEVLKSVYQFDDLVDRLTSLREE